MQQFRFDNVYHPKITLTKEGYMRGEAVVTRTGVFKYKNADGTIRKELRHPDDVLNPASLETLKLIPITNDHPAFAVNADNADRVMIGLVGENIKVDQNDVTMEIIASLNITHKNGITEANRGKRELSLGYNLDLLEESGVYNGEEYTHRQTNIVYNHLALVTQARAGRSARLNLDGYFIEDENINNDKEESNMTQEESIVSTTNNDSEKVEAQKRLDQAEAVIDQLKSELSALKASRTDSVISEKAAAKVALLTKATKVMNVDAAELAAKSEREIMEAVIKSVDNAVNLDGKSDVYVEGRFDSIVETHVNTTPAIERQLSNIKPVLNTDATYNSKTEGKSAMYKKLWEISRGKN